jgi:hypothetical protein
MNLRDAFIAGYAAACSDFATFCGSTEVIGYSQEAVSVVLERLAKSDRPDKATATPPMTEGVWSVDRSRPGCLRILDSSGAPVVDIPQSSNHPMVAHPRSDAIAEAIMQGHGKIKIGGDAAYGKLISDRLRKGYTLAELARQLGHGEQSLQAHLDAYNRSI